jgi:DNA-binding MarR family transcriptional regulator
MIWRAREGKLLRIASFGLLTNHAHVLLCVARDPEMRLREIAQCAGITERAAHRIVCELEEEGYLARRREGRRNVYEVHAGRALPHPLERPARVADLLKALTG